MIKFVSIASAGLSLLILAITTAPATGAAASSEKPLFEDRVVAEGRNFEIRASELERDFTAFKANLAAQGQALPNSRRDAMERMLLDRMIFTRLLIKRATEEEKTAGKRKAKSLLETQRSRAGSETQFRQKVLSLGLSLEQFERQLTEQAISEEVLYRLLGDKIKVSDAQVREYYDEHPKDFQYPEQVEVAHILIASIDPATGQSYPPAVLAERRQLAESLCEKAKAGEDFTKLVEQYSEDPVSKNRGGTYTFPRGQMVPEFEAAAFSMDPGQISDVVESKYGFHVIKLIRKIPVRMESFENVADDIRDRLELIETQKHIPALKEQLMQEAEVKIYEENLR